MDFALTSDQHDADGEHFLRICVGRYVAKPNASQTAQSKVERCNVLRPDRWSSSVVHVRLLRLLRKIIEPSDLQVLQMRALCISDRIPDAGEPVSNERKRCHEQQKNGCSVL